MSTEHRQHWSNYWRQGHLTSLPQGFTGNYDGEFQAFWESRFAALPRGARVLDVCAGNGSIALLACEYSQRHGLDLQVSAADAAAIDAAQVTRMHPQLARHIGSITFLPETPLEALAVTAGPVDLVTSQFGVEYTDWEASAGTIARTLRPGGEFAMICHSADSRIVREMEAQHADYTAIAGIGPLEPATDAARPGDVPGHLEQALQALYRLFQQNRSSQLMSALGGRLESLRKLASQQPDAAWREFVALRDGLAVSRGIAGDLLGVNRALGRNPQWHEVFTAAGLVLASRGDIHYRTGETAGRSYVFASPD